MNPSAEHHPHTTPMPAVGEEHPPTAALPRAHREAYAPRRRSNRGAKLLLAVTLILFAAAALAVGAGTAGTTLSEPSPAELEVESVPTPIATTAPMTPQVVLPDTGGATAAAGDAARRAAFTVATAPERRLTGVDRRTAYDQAAELCGLLDAGADPGPTVASHIDTRSTLTTVVPVAKTTATGIGIICPSHYQGALESMRSFTTEVPAAPAWDRLF